MYLCLPTLCLPKTGKEPLFANFFLKKKISGKKRLFANFFSWGNGKLLWTWNSAPSTFRDRKYFSTLFYFKSMLLFVCARWTNLDVIVNEIGLQILQKLYYQVSNFFVFFNWSTVVFKDQTCFSTSFCYSYVQWNVLRDSNIIPFVKKTVFG